MTFGLGFKVTFPNKYTRISSGFGDYIMSVKEK